MKGQTKKESIPLIMPHWESFRRHRIPGTIGRGALLKALALNQVPSLEPTLA